MLRTVRDKRTYDVPMEIAGEEVVFRISGMSLDDRAALVATCQTAQENSTNPIGDVLDEICKHVVWIKGHEGTPREILGALEYDEDLHAIMKGLVDFTTLPEAERKNLLSSPGRPILASAGSPVEKPVEKVVAPVSTIPEKTAP